MARPREFDPESVLQQAMELFWQNGYEATSIADVVKHTGVSRYGLYSVFGDKHDLFLKAIEFYDKTALKFMVAPLESKTAGIEEIKAYFGRLLAPIKQEQPTSGCLIGNTALEMAQPPQDVGIKIETYFSRLHSAFENALANSVKKGELPSETNPADVASYFVGVVNGYLGMLRIGATGQMIVAFIERALTVLK